MDPSGRKGVFVGYSESAKAYRIYIPGQRKIELSRDVTFEDIAYRRSRHLESDSDEQEAPQEVLASPSPTVERESMEEDDSVPPTYLMDLFVPDSDLVDPTLVQFMCEPRQMHWVVAKLVFLHGTIGYDMRYTSSSDFTLVAYSDFLLD